MDFINTVSVTKFSLNGIEYIKNYVTKVAGDRLTVFNCYDNKDVLLPLTLFSDITLNGVLYPDIESLQSAILFVLYSRNSLGGDPYIAATFADMQTHINSLPSGAYQEYVVLSDEKNRGGNLAYYSRYNNQTYFKIITEYN